MKDDKRELNKIDWLNSRMNVPRLELLIYVYVPLVKAISKITHVENSTTMKLFHLDQLKKHITNQKGCITKSPA